MPLVVISLLRFEEQRQMRNGVCPMTSNQPHPQRCETCKNVDCDLHEQGKGNRNPETGYEWDHYHWYHKIIDVVGCASHSSATEPEKIPDSATLIEVAETEWHNREGRFGLHDKIPWTTGWMSGFLTPNKPDWSKDHDAFIAQAERERVLDEFIRLWESDFCVFPDKTCSQDDGLNQCPVCIAKSLRSGGK